MSGVTDLVLDAQPALCTALGAGTEGRSWRFEVNGICDFAGTAIDLTTGVAVAKILDSEGGTVLTFTTTTGVVSDTTSDKYGGFITGTAAPSDTVGKAASKKERRCAWSLVLTLSGSQVQFWGPTDSLFTIEGE